MRSPTQRTLTVLRRRGYLDGILEHWKFRPVDPQRAPMLVRLLVRSDLWNIFDIIALHPEHGLLLVQTTSATNFSARIAKIKAACVEEPRLLSLPKFAAVQVHGWGQKIKADRQYNHLRAEQMDGAGNFTPVSYGEDAWSVIPAKRKPKRHGPSGLLRDLYGLGEEHGQ